MGGGCVVGISVRGERYGDRREEEETEKKKAMTDRKGYAKQRVPVRPGQGVVLLLAGPCQPHSAAWERAFCFVLFVLCLFLSGSPVFAVSLGPVTCPCPFLFYQVMYYVYVYMYVMYVRRIFTSKSIYSIFPLTMYFCAPPTRPGETRLVSSCCSSLLWGEGEGVARPWQAWLVYYLFYVFGSMTKKKVVFGSPS